MILRGARVATGPRTAPMLDLQIASGFIHRIGSSIEGPGLDLSGYLCLPGLINAHDHLEFNLFPRLGHARHPNMAAWARHVYRPEQSPVREHRSVPKRERMRWGAIKNLISGVTTVCHHNAHEPSLFNADFPVSVVRAFGWAHSFSFPPDVRSQYPKAPLEWPFILHAAESTDGTGDAEFRQLRDLGALAGNLVLVHAVDLKPVHWRALRQAGASVITCPSSNLFTLGRTLNAAAFRSGVPIALGTDSALTSHTDLLDELRVARREWGLSYSQLYRMVTTIPARILRLSSGEGTLDEGASADVVVFRDRGLAPAETLLDARSVDLVIRRGRVRMASPRLAVRLPASVRRRLSPLRIAGRGCMFVDAPIASLIQSVAQHVPGPLRLAGKKILPWNT